jgi:hypothetical protein
MGSSASAATGVFKTGFETATGLAGGATSLLPSNPVTQMLDPLTGKITDVGKTLGGAIPGGLGGAIPGLDSLTGTLTSLPGTLEKQ